jgi:NitT/TauT family transport system substrate-binding protein
MKRAVLAVLLLLAGTAAHAQSRDVLYLLPAPVTSPGFGAWMLAQQRGYYKQAGLNVTFQVARGGVDAAKQIGAGNAPIGGAIGDTSILVRANGIPVRTVAVLGGGSLTQIVVNKDRVASIADLRGKTITTMSYQDTTFFALLGVLATQGMTKNDVNAQAVGPSAVWQLFASGKSDAMAASPDWTVEALRANPNGHFQILPTDAVFKSMGQAVVTSDAMIQHDPELIRKLVVATLHGFTDIIADPNAAATDYVKQIPDFADKRDMIVQIFQMYDQQVYPGQPKPGWVDAARLAALQQFYLKQGIIEHATPVDELYTNEFIE